MSRMAAPGKRATYPSASTGEQPGAFGLWFEVMEVRTVPGAEAGSPTAWQEARAQLAQAGRFLELDEGIIEMLGQPRRVVEVAIPIRTDSGRLRTVAGWRAQHSHTRGPAQRRLR